MKMLFRLVLVFALLSAILPVRALACACCAERGDYFEHESAFSDYEVNETARLRLGSSILRTDDGYPESIRGIESLSENYTINGILKGEVWSLELTGDNSKKAVLNLWRPSHVVSFGVDQNPLDESNSVILYRELRFKNRVMSATGFLENGIDSETTFSLILQGRGNGCMNASDFSTYILQIKGNKADYSFFGKLNLEDDKVMQKFIDAAGAKAAN